MKGTAAMVLKWSVSLSERWRELKARDSDSGEGPVPYLIMVGVIAAGAILVAGIIITTATGWAEDVPTFDELP
jgi:hypothetical protein